MKFANFKNEFEMVGVLQEKNLCCKSKGGMKGQQITAHLSMDLQEILDETD